MAHQQSSENNSFAVLFQDYPSILTGLSRLNITTPTDFQFQLLQLESPMDNLIVSAPHGSGKTIALLLLSLRPFINEEQGTLVFLCHSKDLSQSLRYLLSQTTSIKVINLWMGEKYQDGGKQILLGSPTGVNKLMKKQKDVISGIVIVQADYLMSYGYGDDLQLLAGSLSSKIGWKLSCCQITPDIDSFKQRQMTKVVKIDYMPTQQNQQAPVKIQDKLTHYYTVGDNLSLPISVYVTLKFGLVSPKILLLVDTLRDVYRFALFLERCRIPQVGVYNHENPIDLRFYNLSVWMNGGTHILIATRHLIDDLDSKIFKPHAKKAYNRGKFELVNMTAIITVGLQHLQSHTDKLLDLFEVKPFLMTFVSNSEQQIGNLQNLIKIQNGKYESTRCCELPITKSQLDGFRYRVGDVWSGLNNFRVDLYQQLDFKKKVLRSPELKQQFTQNTKERDLLVKSINDLRKKIDHNKVTLSDFVPEYLVPECLRHSYAEKMKVLAEREEGMTASNKKVRRVLRHVDLDEENPENTDVSRLKLISARKRWKLLHGFKLKKRNMRNQKKGVFQNG